MSEKIAYDAFRKNAAHPLDRIHRIENLVGFGFPDVNACMSGVEMWIEIKAPKEPKRATTPLFGSNHKLSQDQKNWFLAQSNAGGIGWLLIMTSARWMLIAGQDADPVNEMTIEELMRLTRWWAMGPLRPAQWSALRKTLIHGGRKW